MGIQECLFDSEAELEGWVLRNISTFLGNCITLGKVQISTPGGKRGIPDGFAFNFSEREWYVLEAELLKHGVWPHIAEQITRFVVALQHRESLRKLRDSLFEEILSQGDALVQAQVLGVSVERLLQQVELFVEGVQPQIAIFIDDTNQDLTDFAHALDVPTRIYRVKKFRVNGVLEYYSPDHNTPALETTPQEIAHTGSQDLDVVERLGGGRLLSGSGRFKCYDLTDGRVIHIKRSKFHERHDYYWYGANPGTLDQARQVGITHFVFVLGEWGFSLVSLDDVIRFCNKTSTSNNADGSIRHYHILISPEPSPALYGYADVPRIDLTADTYSFA